MGKGHQLGAYIGIRYPSLSGCEVWKRADMLRHNRLCRTAMVGTKHAPAAHLTSSISCCLPASLISSLTSTAKDRRTPAALQALQASSHTAASVA